MLQRYYRALRAASPVVLSLLRIVTALVLMEHGTQKMFDFPPMPRFGGIPGAAAAQPGGGAPAALQAQRANAGAPAAPAGAAATAAAPGPAGAADTNTTAAQAALPAGAAPAAPTGRGGGAGGGRAGGGPGAGPGGGGPGGGFRGPPAYLFPIAGWIETFGGALLVLGLFTRSAAFLLSGETAVIYFIAHAPTGFFPATNGGEPVVLFCWVFLYVFFAGAGPISLDALFRRLRGRSAVTGRPLPLQA